MSNPILSNVTFNYAENEILEHSLTSTNFHTYYQGSEMVVAGRLPDYPSKLLEYEIVANQADGKYSVAGSYNTTNRVCIFVNYIFDSSELILFKTMSL